MAAVLSIKKPLRPELAAKLGKAAPAVAAVAKQPKDPAIAQRVAKWAMQTFPAVFAAPKPLARTIGRDLKAQRPEGVSNLGVNRFLAQWTRQRAYIEALAADGAQRHGLDGVTVEPVSAAHRAHALARLEKLG